MRVAGSGRTGCALGLLRWRFLPWLWRGPRHFKLLAPNIRVVIHLSLPLLVPASVVASILRIWTAVWLELRSLLGPWQREILAPSSHWAWSRSSWRSSHRSAETRVTHNSSIWDIFFRTRPSLVWHGSSRSRATHNRSTHRAFRPRSSHWALCARSPHGTLGPWPPHWALSSGSSHWTLRPWSPHRALRPRTSHWTLRPRPIVPFRRIPSIGG